MTTARGMTTTAHAMTMTTATPMHPTGIKGFLYGLFVPHTHDAADSVDDALEASEQGVRALKISLFMLLGTTILQFLVVLISGPLPCSPTRSITSPTP